jgi:hypothetical protein
LIILKNTDKNYRNNKILKGAEHSPYCFGCGKPNDGTIVAAHSNQGRDGKGLGIKSHDFRVAYLCYTCHAEVDGGSGTQEEKVEKWEQAHRLTIAYLILSGILK